MSQVCSMCHLILFPVGWYWWPPQHSESVLKPTGLVRWLRNESCETLGEHRFLFLRNNCWTSNKYEREKCWTFSDARHSFFWRIFCYLHSPSLTSDSGDPFRGLRVFRCSIQATVHCGHRAGVPHHCSPGPVLRAQTQQETDFLLLAPGCGWSFIFSIVR